MARKVILSRKGFDSSNGGKPSPIIDGEFLSLPIPKVESDIFYRDLTRSNGDSYLKVMKDLNIKQFTEANLDPDLRKSSLKVRSKEWRGLFGQAGHSQSALHKRSVGKDDIFLFFGWFKQAKKINGSYQYVRGAPNVHAIYGYLEVGEVFDVLADAAIPPWATYHPHIKNKTDYDKNRNVVYAGKETLTANNDIKGWGSFRYDKRLVLTKEGVKTRSLWTLPACFKNEEDNFLHKVVLTELPNGLIEMTPSGRGNQEMFISDNRDIVKWAQELIGSCSK